ncbi:hypothetical protein CC78DRAFT_611285, partial [Lojkania enalia]
MQNVISTPHFQSEFNEMDIIEGEFPGGKTWHQTPTTLSPSPYILFGRSQHPNATIAEQPPSLPPSTPRIYGPLAHGALGIDDLPRSGFICWCNSDAHNMHGYAPVNQSTACGDPDQVEFVKPRNQSSQAPVPPKKSLSNMQSTTGKKTETNPFMPMPQNLSVIPLQCPSDSPDQEHTHSIEYSPDELISSNWSPHPHSWPQAEQLHGGINGEDKDPYLDAYPEHVPAPTRDNPPPKLCSQCPAIYTGQYAQRNLVRHVQCKHGSTIAIFPCTICTRTYQRKDALVKHQRGHPELGKGPPKTRKKYGGSVAYSDSPTAPSDESRTSAE